ncbi:MAG: DUF2085 domain-containing protein [bacterium]|nr:MAG: DUF2085 domain-containing protein [bacterium]
MIIKSEHIHSYILTSVLIWCLLIVIAPFLAHLKLVFSSGFIYLFFSKICHQYPERSFFIWDKQFAVCARCSGLYFGFLIATIFFPFLKGLKNFTPPPRYLFFIALTPITIDLSLTIFHIWQNTFFTRFASGLLLGNVVALFVLSGIHKIREENYELKS